MGVGGCVYVGGCVGGCVGGWVWVCGCVCVSVCIYMYIYIYIYLLDNNTHQIDHSPGGGVVKVIVGLHKDWHRIANDVTGQGGDLRRRHTFDQRTQHLGPHICASKLSNHFFNEDTSL